MTSQELISHEEAKRHAFDTVLHRNSSKTDGGIRAMASKNSAANNAAANDYFQYWDNKKAEEETEEVRQERTENYASLTRQYAL